MGSLLSGVNFKEPTTVEDCDSTWETDSEPELQELAAGEEGKEPLEGLGVEGGGGGGGEEKEGAGGGDGYGHSAEDKQQQQQGEPLPAANYPPEDVEQRQGEEGAAEENEEEEDEVEAEGEGAHQEAGGPEEAEAASTEQKMVEMVIRHLLSPTLLCLRTRCFLNWWIVCCSLLAIL